MRNSLRNLSLSPRHGEGAKSIRTYDNIFLRDFYFVMLVCQRAVSITDIDFSDFEKKKKKSALQTESSRHFL